MKSGTRKMWKEVSFEETVFSPEDLTLEEKEEIVADPVRNSVMEAYRDTAKAEKLMLKIVEDYFQYKQDKYGYDANISANLVRKAKDEGKHLFDYVPELYLDHIFQCLNDYLKGVKVEVAFGLNKSVGRKQKVDELEVAKCLHKLLKKNTKYEQAIAEVMEKFGLGSKRIKMIYNYYSKLDNFDAVVKFDLKYGDMGGKKVVMVMM